MRLTHLKVVEQTFGHNLNIELQLQVDRDSLELNDEVTTRILEIMSTALNVARSMVKQGLTDG